MAGWIPDDLGGCPPPALGRLAAALAIDAHSAAALLAAYGGWQGETRRRHRVQVLARRGWRWCAAGERKLLDEFLLTRALEHDAPGVLVQLACDWMRAERIVRPPVDTLTRRVAAARDAARAETALEEQQNGEWRYLEFLQVTSLITADIGESAWAARCQ